MVDSRVAPARSRRQPHPYYQWLVEYDPVHLDTSSGAHFLSRHADCSAALKDPRLSAQLGQRQRRRADSLPRSMLNTDPPDHDRLRDPAAAVVSPARLSELCGRLTPVVTHFLRRITERGQVEAISEFAAPLAAVTLATLLGVPTADLRTFTALARAASANLDPLAGPDVGAAGAHAAVALSDYMRQLLDSGSVAADSGTAVLMRSVDDNGFAPGRISTEELLSTLVLFVVGGYEPLVHVIGNGLLALSQNPAERRRLLDGTASWRTALDELLRWEAPIPFTARVCREEMTIRDHRLSGGDVVVILLAAANRDPRVFARPDALDVSRHPNPMLGFGGGAHLCLAAPLVRAVGQLVLRSAIEAFPCITVREYAWRDCLVPRGLDRVILSLDDAEPRP